MEQLWSPGGWPVRSLQDGERVRPGQKGPLPEGVEASQAALDGLSPFGQEKPSELVASQWASKSLGVLGTKAWFRLGAETRQDPQVEHMIKSTALFHFRRKTGSDWEPPQRG